MFEIGNSPAKVTQNTAPLTRSEKIAVALAISALAITILGAIAYKVHFPHVVSFMNNSHITRALTAGGCTFLLSSLIFLETQRCKKKNLEKDLNIEPSKPQENQFPEENPDEVKKSTVSLDLSNLNGSIKEDNALLNIDPPELPVKNSTEEKVEEELKELKNLLMTMEENDLSFIGNRSPDVLRHYRPLIRKYSTSYPKLSAELKRGNEKPWLRIEAKILRLTAKASPFFVERSRIRWVTGTRSPTLIGMNQIAKKTESNTPALMATGMLVEQNVVPLTGELGSGIGSLGVNRGALSGTVFFHYEGALSYAEAESFICKLEEEKNVVLDFDIEDEDCNFLRLKIAVLRLIHLGADENTLQEVKDHLVKNVLSKMTDPLITGWEKYVGLVGNNTNSYNLNEITDYYPGVGALVGVKRSNGEVKFGVITNIDMGYDIVVEKDGTLKPNCSKLYYYQKENLERLAEENPPSSQELNAIREKISTPLENKPIIEEILQLFETEKALTLDEQEEKFLTENNFPVVWGSTTKLNTVPVRSDISGEKCVSGILNLGSEIDLVFTKQKKIPDMQNWLDKRGFSSVTVMSFGTALILRMLSN